MPSRVQLRVLLVLLLVNVTASVLHYVDNIRFFDAYPEPAWISPHFIDAFWFVMTPFAVVGFFLFSKGSRWGSAASLAAYALMSLLVLGHYRYASPWALSFRVNLFILSEAVAALMLLGFALSVVVHSVPRTRDTERFLKKR